MRGVTLRESRRRHGLPTAYVSHRRCSAHTDPGHPAITVTTLASISANHSSSQHMPQLPVLSGLANGTENSKRPSGIGAGRLAAVRLSQKRALLPDGKLPPPGGRHDLRLGPRRGPEHPVTRPAGSFRDARVRTRRIEVHRRIQYCCHE